MKIKIGKAGQQPFAIKASNVSRLHAEVDIDEQSGIWTLTDLNSTNGTFIRDERTGELRRISKVNIQPMTFICLGTDNSKGCTFYARQLLAPGDYNDEMRFIIAKEEEYNVKQKQIERDVRLLRLAQTVAPVAVFGFSMMLWNESGMESYLLRTAVAALPSVFLEVVFNPKKRQSKLKDYADRFRYCPNPECNHKLRSQDIRNRECPHCNKI